MPAGRRRPQHESELSRRHDPVRRGRGSRSVRGTYERSLPGAPNFTIVGSAPNHDGSGSGNGWSVFAKILNYDDQNRYGVSVWAVCST